MSRRTSCHADDMEAAMWDDCIQRLLGPGSIGERAKRQSRALQMASAALRAAGLSGEEINKIISNENTTPC